MVPRRTTLLVTHLCPKIRLSQENKAEYDMDEEHILRQSQNNSSFLDEVDNNQGLVECNTCAPDSTYMHFADDQCHSDGSIGGGNSKCFSLYYNSGDQGLG